MITRRAASDAPPGNRRGPPDHYQPPGYTERLAEALRRVAGPDAPERGWRAEAGRRLGVSRVSVHGWVAGHSTPSIAHLVEIARLSGVSAHWLLLGEGSIDAPVATPTTGTVP